MTSRSPNTERSSWLGHAEYVAALRREAGRLAQVLRGQDDDAPVPTCPGWTATDLTRHVVQVYAGKAAVLRTGEPVSGESVDLAAGLPLAAALDRHDAVVADLADLLSGLDPAAPSWTWMEGAGESTVGAWGRRMAHEALVHRVDAELAAGADLAPTDDALAVDGVNEVLTWMAGDPDLVASPEAAAGSAGTVLVDDGRGGWLVDLGDGVQRVRPAAPSDEASAQGRVSGEPFALDLALWGRPADVAWTGDADVLARLRARLGAALR